MLDLVSWKSLLALSMPWKTWKVGTVTGVKGRERSFVDLEESGKHGCAISGEVTGARFAVEFYF